MDFPDQKQRRVLAAVSHSAFAVLSQALGDDFTLVFCASLTTAKALLHEPFDVVIAGIHFDDGQVFELLRVCKSSTHMKEVAFVCIKCLDSELNAMVFEAVDSASKALGGDGFINLYRWIQNFGADQAYEKLRNAIGALIQARNNIR